MRRIRHLENSETDFDRSTGEAADFPESNSDVGLSSEEVEKRLEKYGFNEVSEKKANSFALFAKKFWGLTAWMLEIIIVLSWILQRYFDVYIVIALLFLNSVLGFFEEQRASGAVEALKKRLQVNARVLRDGVWKIVSSRELVPGDTVRVRAGDFVPADVKIVLGEVSVDQSTLTGESMEIDKKPDDTLYSGSVVKRGEATAIVTLTGAKTYFGRTTELVQIARPKLHMEEVISKVVRWLLVVVLVLLLVASTYSAMKGISLLEILPLVLVLLLSAIPVALPAMFTISTSIGSMELIKKGVLVTRLNASEDAADMNILCVDKTGTITMNQLSVTNVFPLNGFSESEVILFGALASQEANQDPIDLAFVEMAKERKLVDKSFMRKNFVPFDPKSRKTEATILKNGHEFHVIKGAVSTVAQVCSLDQNSINEMEDRIGEFATKGYRTIGVAKADFESKPEFIGLVTLHDLPRPDSKQLIEDLRNLGVSVKMLTGDSLPIAKEVARSVGLGEYVSTASELKSLIVENSAKAAEIAERSDGFAEVYPEDKYAIVRNLQSRNHVIGMTGDGVNDAPALRQAEVGIAVNSATDVAKSAASVVLTNEGLTNIVDLVKNGRVIHERITAWILSKIVRTLQMASLVVMSFLATGSYVVSAFAVILLFFMTDFVKISLSTDNLKWSRRPETWNIAAIVKGAIILSLLVIAESFGLLYIGLTYFHLSTADQTLYTFTFEIFFYSAMFLILNVRERGHFWHSMPSKILLATMILSITVTTAMSTIGIPGLIALPLTTTGAVILYSCVCSLIVNDFVKFILVRKDLIGW